MKKRIPILLSFVFIFFCIFQNEAAARRGFFDNFLALKPGLYSPQDSALDGLDEDFSGTVAFGEYTSETFAWGVELTHAAASFDGKFVEDELTFNAAKLFLTWVKPLGKRRRRKGEFHFTLGGGIYSVEAEHKEAGISDKGRDDIYGGEVGLGFNYNLSKRFFIGIEGRYLLTTDAKVLLNVGGVATPIEFSLDGYAVMGSFGVRFDFIPIFRRR